METAYKLRFIPLVLGVLTLLSELAMRLLVPASGYRTLIYGAVLTVVGFIFMQLMRQLQRERTQEQQDQQSGTANAAVQSENPENAQQDDMADQADRIKNGIPFLIVRAAFSLIISLMGVSWILTDRVLPGVGILLLGALLCLLHVHWVVKSVRELKAIKRMRMLNR